MKHFLFFLFTLAALFSGAQINYSKQNIDLVGFINPNFGVPANDNKYYSGCWGWYQQSKNKEYAISGASNGTYFIDVTNPATPSVSAYVAGKLGCTWREIKTYQNYCYIISDDPKPNKFQIVDMQYLPDSVHIVHDGTSIFEHAHTLWIDKDKMYVGLVSYTAGFSSMNIYSLATPSVPVLLRELQQDIAPPLINEVHDMYARNDTVYASCGWEGLYVLKYNSTTNNFTQLGSYANYASPAYNHSSALTKNGKYLVFCDEVPPTKPIRLVDVQNLGNIQPVQTFNPYPTTTPHNPYMLGNDFVVVSCYMDGLYIYDISQPGNAAVSGYFDTHYQGGGNVGDYFGAAYRGNWGAYPYLPSGLIIAQDMQNGVYILDATQAFNNRVGIKQNQAQSPLNIYPNPASGTLFINSATAAPALIQVRNTLGQLIYEKQVPGPVSEQLNVRNFENGTYILTLTEPGRSLHQKIIIQH